MFQDAPDLQPIIQPRNPFVDRLGERIAATYPVVGPAEFRFWISRLAPDESLDDYDIAEMLHPQAERRLKVKMEINLGVVKLTFS